MRKYSLTKIVLVSETLEWMSINTSHSLRFSSVANFAEPLFLPPSSFTSFMKKKKYRETLCCETTKVLANLLCFGNPICLDTDRGSDFIGGV